MSMIFKNTYYNSYYYANIISNILSRDIELIGFISIFFANEDSLRYLGRPFEKNSAFHCFIQHIISDFFEEDMNEYDQRNFPLSIYADIVLDEFDIGTYKFADFIDGKANIQYSDLEEYLNELKLTGTFESLYEKISQEVFYLLFNNRNILLQFNYIVAEHMPVEVSSIDEDYIKKLFNKSGYLKRVAIPEWCKKAVYFRDRGRCCLCTKDISGLLSLDSIKHYDHIVPLAQGGLNDVSNIQLLCSLCNFKKGKHTIETSDYYEGWY